ncbi:MULTISPECIES: DUF3037 domain-containing protein [Clostridium]|uniref:DUF3037 domain-containing protein n=1 Tax=Clostridium TaxID=1485 RepID=UPI0006C214F4|nr:MULTISPECIES: DUF3037 domain-containing protein [Clostridium]CUN66821.1 Protein of uncharacterised function (DUF3037) [Clostridium disporicum]
MEKKKKIVYSIIRYEPDEIRGEVVNIGVVLYSNEDAKVKYYILDENSIKLKGILENEVELKTYKSYKDVFEYYIEECKEDMAGIVGEVYISSYLESDFINKLYNHYLNKPLHLSKENIAITADEDLLFNTLLKRYVGKSNIDIDKATTLNAKKYMKQIFSSNDKLTKKVISDFVIKPIKELDDLEVKIDFTFKNGKWNYMQTIPKITSKNKNADWFSKIQLILDAKNDSNLYIIYKYSDILEDNSTLHLLKYLQNRYGNLQLCDIEDNKSINNLCDYIEKEGQILDLVV